MVGVESNSKIDRKRYAVVRTFFVRLFVHLLFWDIILNRPGLRWLRRKPKPRWQKISRNYRHLAIDLGGVLIKLGQFLSVRVDILPREVTIELADLRDEIPAEPIAAIVHQIEEDFGRSIKTLFAWFSPEPVGAASLGQVHLARLATDNREVAVKVLRPGIDVLVETDLAAIGLAVSWLKRYRRISSRVDLDWLMDEFSQVTRAELDCVAEGKNAERFAQDFADNPAVYVPRIYWEYCAARTLTMENVGYIKISDQQQLVATGINAEEVAGKIYNFYLQQIFTTHFVHADPHPGNIFIKPLPTKMEEEMGRSSFGPGEEVVYQENRPFQVVFVDFGMMTVIPDRLRAALREYVVGVATRDAFRVVQAYVQADTLLPGADLKRLEEVHQALLDRLWGANAQQMQGIVFADARVFMQQYRDVIYDAPFQFQADMLFAGRAVAILSGIATQLDATFDPWQKIIPFAERLAAEDLRANWRQWLKEGISLAQNVSRLSKSAGSVLSQAERGNLTLKTSFTPENRQLFLRLERSINRLSGVVAAVGLLLGGLLIRHDNPDSRYWLVLVVVAALLFIYGIWANRKL